MHLLFLCNKRINNGNGKCVLLYCSVDFNSGSKSGKIKAVHQVFEKLLSRIQYG